MENWNGFISLPRKSTAETGRYWFGSGKQKLEESFIKSSVVKRRQLTKALNYALVGMHVLFFFFFCFFFLHMTCIERGKCVHMIREIF